ncbi:uncharacterized protein LOC144491126, partial [Mustelus asterias]
DPKPAPSSSHELKWPTQPRFRDYRDRPFYQRPPVSVPLPPPPPLYDRPWTRYVEPLPPVYRSREPLPPFDPYEAFDRTLRRRPGLEDPRERLYREGPRFGLYHTF